MANKVSPTRVEKVIEEVWTVDPIVKYATTTPLGEKVEAFMVQMFNVFRKMVDAVTLLAVIVFLIMVSYTPTGNCSVAELNVLYMRLLP